MNFQLSGRDHSDFGVDMGAGFFSRIVQKTKNAITDPNVISAVQNGPAGQAVFSVLPSRVQTLVRRGSNIIDSTKSDIENSVGKQAKAEVRANLAKAGLWVLGIGGIAAGAYALSQHRPSK